MSSHNPVHESPQTTQPQDPPSSSQESKKIKPHEKEWRPEEKSKRVATPKPAEDGGCERLKRHRVEMSGGTRIPDKWSQEDLLKGWIDCAAFDAPLISSSILKARDALAEEGRRASSTRLRIHN